jgi:xanthine dehydrogenase FAD-binding subunit
MAISIASLSWRWDVEPDGTLRDARIALGALAPTVIRARDAEAEIEGKRPNADAATRAARAVSSAVSPIDDVRASAWYRREVAGELLREALTTPANVLRDPGPAGRSAVPTEGRG